MFVSLKQKQVRMFKLRYSIPISGTSSGQENRAALGFILYDSKRYEIYVNLPTRVVLDR